MNPTEIEDCIKRLELWLAGGGASRAPSVEPTAFSILQEESRKAVEEELYLKYSVDISRATENVDEYDKSKK